MTAILIFGAVVGAILGRCDFKVFALVAGDVTRRGRCCRDWRRDRS